MDNECDLRRGNRFFPGVESRRLNWHLPLLFVLYFLATAALFWFLARVLRLMPWDISWVFLLLFPPMAGALLGIGVWKGRYTGLAVGVFFLSAVVLGMFYFWLGQELAAAV